MNYYKIKYLNDASVLLDSTVANSKNISRCLRETYLTRPDNRGFKSREGEECETCPVCFTPWSSGRFSLRLQSCHKTIAKKKESLKKLLRKKTSRLNRYQKALFERIRSKADKVMRLTCMECKSVTKKYVTKSPPLLDNMLSEEAEITDVVEPSLPAAEEQAPVKKKKKKRKKDSMCGLKLSAVVQVRLNKSRANKASSTKVDCNSQISNVLPESSSLRKESFTTNKLISIKSNIDPFANKALKQTSQLSEMKTNEICDFKENQIKFHSSRSFDKNIPCSNSNNLTDKTDDKNNHLISSSLNSTKKTEINVGNQSFIKSCALGKRNSDSDDFSNQNKCLKFNRNEIEDNKLISVSKSVKELESVAMISDLNRKTEISRTFSITTNKIGSLETVIEKREVSLKIPSDEVKNETFTINSNQSCRTESLLNDSDQVLDKSETKKLERNNKKLNEKSANKKINLLSQPSLNNMLQINICTNSNKNKNKRNSNDMKNCLNTDTKINNNDNSKQCNLSGKTLRQTKNNKNNGKKAKNNRVNNKRKNINNRVFEELTCRNSLCVKDLLNLT